MRFLGKGGIKAEKIHYSKYSVNQRISKHKDIYFHHSPTKDMQSILVP